MDEIGADHHKRQDFRGEIDLIDQRAVEGDGGGSHGDGIGVPGPGYQPA